MLEGYQTCWRCQIWATPIKSPVGPSKGATGQSVFSQPTSTLHARNLRGHNGFHALHDFRRHRVWISSPTLGHRRVRLVHCLDGIGAPRTRDLVRHATAYLVRVGARIADLALLGKVVGRSRE